MIAGNLLRCDPPYGKRPEADLTVAKLVLSADIGDATAVLTGWSGVRLGQDTIWKAPKTKPIAYHQDSFYGFSEPAAAWALLDSAATGRCTTNPRPTIKRSAIQSQLLT